MPRHPKDTPSRPASPEDETPDQPQDRTPLSPELLRELLDHLPIMVEARDAEGNIVFWNKESEQATGRTAREMVGNPDALKILYPDREYREQMLAMRARRGHDYRSWEWIVRCLDGGDKLVSRTSIADRFPVEGWASWDMGIDLTERSRVETMVVRAKREWERTFDSVPDCIIILGTDFRVRRLNRAAAERLDIPPDEAAGRVLKELLKTPSDPDGEEIVSQIRSMAEDGATVGRELRIPRLGGHFLATVSPFYLDEEGPAGTILVAHDISRWKHLEEQLRQTHKMEALGALAGGIAHDFNNILGIMLGYSEMLLEGAEQNSPQERKLKEILSAGDRARDLINQILTFSRQDLQELRVLRLTPLIKETLKLVGASLPGSVDIQLKLATEQDSVLADPTQIHQILMNLSTNAAHAMGAEGGVLKISLTDVYVEDENQPGLPQLTPGSYACLTVRDTGTGVAPVIADRIFEPFFTTKKPGEGTGMGLAVVHGIVRKLGGGVALENAPGNGAAFHVYLPRARPLDEVSLGGEEDIPLGSGRILLVDDEQALVEVEREILSRLGYTVTTHTGPVEALEEFKTQPDAFDLVLTDLSMPGMTGLELAKTVLALRPKTPVLLCTGFSEIVSMEEAKEMGVRGVIIKPVLKGRLARAVNRALKG